LLDAQGLEIKKGTVAKSPMPSKEESILNMETWITCPKCGDKTKLLKSKGNPQISGGTFEDKCRRCKALVEIFDDCKTRVANPKST
jgi:hypothetical protein